VYTFIYQIHFFSFLMVLLPPISTLFPYTTLFRSEFRIKALDASASVVSCVIDAVDEADARRQLALKELKIISLEPVRRLRRLERSEEHTSETPVTVRSRMPSSA